MAIVVKRSGQRSGISSRRAKRLTIHGSLLGVVELLGVGVATLDDDVTAVERETDCIVVVESALVEPLKQGRVREAKDSPRPLTVSCDFSRQDWRNSRSGENL